MMTFELLVPHLIILGMGIGLIGIWVMVYIFLKAANWEAMKAIRESHLHAEHSIYLQKTLNESNEANEKLFEQFQHYREAHPCDHDDGEEEEEDKDEDEEEDSGIRFSDN